MRYPNAIGRCGDCGGYVARAMDGTEACQSCGAVTARSALPTLPMAPKERDHLAGGNGTDSRFWHGASLLAIGLCLLAATGCLSVDKDGDLDLDLNAGDIVSGAEAIDNLIRGTPPVIRLPRGSRWLLVAESEQPIPELVKVERDGHVPTRGGDR